MAVATCSDEEFIKLFTAHGAAGAAKVLNIAVANVYARRRRMESNGARIESPNANQGRVVSKYPAQIPIPIQSGVIMVGSDAHYTPGEISTAHRGFVHLAEEIQPKVMILDGDVPDYPTISRHASIGWSQAPSVRAEHEAIDERLTEIKDACKKADRYWLIGNHCLRFENRLSEKVPEYRDMKGFALADHFPEWKMGISAWVNNDVVIKHRFKGGIHATHNNTLWAGRTMVTGHLHSLKVTPFSDYNGTRWGVDCGTMADVYGSHADYTEDNPLNWRSGFIVLTFHKGKLLMPEICNVVDEDHISFRGKLIRV